MNTPNIPNTMSTPNTMNTMSNANTEKRRISPVFVLLSVLLFSILMALPQKLLAEDVGQFYWHLLTNRNNSSTRYFNANANDFLGFQVTAGRKKNFQHLADIGITSLQETSVPTEASSLRYTARRMEATLGYAYHWSTFYGAEKPGHNIHFGFGFVSGAFRGGQRTERYGIDYSGNYLRFAYFYSVPSAGQPLILGFNLTYKLITSGGLSVSIPSVGVVTAAGGEPITLDVTLGRAIGNPSDLNSVDFSFIIGTNFSSFY